MRCLFGRVSHEWAELKIVLRKDKLSDLKYRIEVKFMPDIIGVRIDSFRGQVNFSCGSVSVVSISQGEKGLSFLGREHAKISAACDVVQRILRRMHPPASELLSKLDKARLPVDCHKWL